MLQDAVDLPGATRATARAGSLGTHVASVYDLKPRFQQLLRPVCRACARAGITANQVTVAAAVMSFGIGATITIWPDARWPLLLVPAGLFVRMALNAIDGMLAREHDMQSALGGVLNELGDVFSDAALYLPLALVGGFPPLLTVVFVLLAVISEMTGVVGVAIGASRRYDGPMGKSDRAFWLGLLTLLLGLAVVPTGPWITWVIVALNVLLLLTIVQRSRRAVAEVR